MRISRRAGLLFLLVTLAVPAAARVRPAARVVRRVDAVAAAAPAIRPEIVPRLATPEAVPPVPPSVTFVENLGQGRPDAAFYARGDGRTLWLEPGAIRLELRRGGDRVADASPAGAAAASGAPGAPGPARVRRADLVETLVDASPRVRLEAGAEQPGRQNFLLGPDPAGWRTGARTYRLVTYRDAWDGVDVRLYGAGTDLEQEYVVRPGAAPARIRLRLGGARGARLARDGSLVVHTPLGPIRQRPPMAYQHRGGERVAVPVRFALLGPDEYGFAVGAYDASAPLVIDPVMRFATFMGGVHDDVAGAVTTDAAGNTYVVGYTASEDFPVTGNAYQHTRANIGVYVYNVFIAKLSPEGVPLYSTFLGGDGAGGVSGDKGNGIALDDLGNIYIAGQAASANFPVTAGTAFQATKAAGTDAFFAKLDPTGTQLLYSTFLGGAGDDGALGIAVDAGRNAYLVGNAPGAGFPTKSAFQTTPHGTDNGFVAKLDATASGNASLVYSTYLGGNGNFGGLFAIAVDSTGHAYVTGQTQASDFPTTAGVLRQHMTLNASCSTSDPPRSAVVVAKLLPDGTNLVWSTYVSGTTENQNGGVGCDQFGHAIAVDASGNVYVQGATDTTDFPTSANAVQKTFGCCQFQNFVMKLKPDASDFLYSTFLTAGNERSFPGSQLVVDAAGNATVTGVTFGSQWHTTPDALQPASGGAFDAFVTKLNADASDYVYSSYLGGNGNDGGNGLAVDADGNTHVAGSSSSSAGFPWTPGAFQHAFAGGDNSDAFIASFGSPLASSGVKPSHAGNAGGITLTIAGTGLQTGATARLAGAQTITARATTVAADGKSARAVFDLTHVPPGAYTPSILNPDSSTFTSPGTFTVDAGGGPALWVDVIGRPKIRVNTPSTFVLTYGNSGNQDAYFVRLWMSVPTASLAIAPGFQLASGDAGGATTSANRDRTIFSVVVPVVPAGSTAALPITVTAPDASDGIPIAAWINPAAFMSLTALDALQAARAQAVGSDEVRAEPLATAPLGTMNLADCYERMIAYSVAALGFNLPQTCLGLFTVGFKNEVAAMVSEAIGANAPPEVFAAALGQVLYKVVQGQVVPCVQATLGSSTPDAAQRIVDGLIDSLVDLVNNTILNQDCQVAVEIDEDGDEDDGGDDDDTDGDDPVCGCPGPPACGDCPGSGGAIDPNDKAGPAGAGAGRWAHRARRSATSSSSRTRPRQRRPRSRSSSPTSSTPPRSTSRPSRSVRSSSAATRSRRPPARRRSRRRSTSGRRRTSRCRSMRASTARPGSSRGSSRRSTRRRGFRPRTRRSASCRRTRIRPPARAACSSPCCPRPGSRAARPCRTRRRSSSTRTPRSRRRSGRTPSTRACRRAASRRSRPRRARPASRSPGPARTPAAPASRTTRSSPASTAGRSPRGSRTRPRRPARSPGSPDTRTRSRAGPGPSAASARRRTRRPTRPRPSRRRLLPGSSPRRRGSSRSPARRSGSRRGSRAC